MLQQLVCLLLASVKTVVADIYNPYQVGHPILELPAGQFKAKKFRVYDSGANPTYLQLLGVQYAEHPIGPLRWQPPKAFVGKPGVVRNATRFGPDCFQAPPGTKYNAIGADRIDEACLFLNVWAPQVKKGSANLPVMFWIHGGSFDLGGTSIFDGTGVMSIRRDVVLVNANYRLGALGFLGGSAVASSTSDGSAGNFGLQDTRLALVWVQENIAALGGDPSRVTIYGQSSGASMVACHLVMPRSSGLFAGAIMESGAFDNFTVQAYDMVEHHFQEFARHTSCNGTDAQKLECMRALPLRGDKSQTLHRAVAVGTNNALFSPVVDGVELMATPEVLAAMGSINPVEGVMLGTTKHEGRYMMPYTLPVDGAPYSTEAQFRTWLESQFPPDIANLVAAKYPAEPEGQISWWATAAKLYTDQQYTCPTQRSAHWMKNSKKVPAENVFVYEYQYEPSSYLSGAAEEYYALWCWGPMGYYQYCPAQWTPMGAGHASEVDLLWADLLYMNSTDFAVAKFLIDWWQDFAITFNPNAKGHFPWAPYHTANTSMIITPDPKPMVGYRREFCDFWDTVHPVPYSDKSLPGLPPHIEVHPHHNSTPPPPRVRPRHQSPPPTRTLLV